MQKPKYCKVTYSRLLKIILKLKRQCTVSHCIPWWEWFIHTIFIFFTMWLPRNCQTMGLGRWPDFSNDKNNESMTDTLDAGVQSHTIREEFIPAQFLPLSWFRFSFCGLCTKTPQKSYLCQSITIILPLDTTHSLEVQEIKHGGQ